MTYSLMLLLLPALSKCPGAVGANASTFHALSPAHSHARARIAKWLEQIREDVELVTRTFGHLWFFPLLWKWLENI